MNYTKKDISILVGNILDKGDLALYGFLAPILGPLFFPTTDPVMQLILIYATSFTSIVTRPCGTFFFGLYAQKNGPLKALKCSLCGVAVTTILIGCIPVYEMIQWCAPLSLVVIRFMRGVCSAGESTIAKMYIMESKIDQHALRASYWYQSSSMLGIILASGISTLIITVYPYAWRWCFIVAGIATLGVLYLRLEDDTKIVLPSYPYKKYTHESIRLLWQHKGNVIRVALVTIFSHMTYSLPFVFMNNFIPLVTTIPLATMMKYNTLLLIFDVIMVPCIGYCTQRYNPRVLMLYASFIVAITIVPLFYFLPFYSLWYVLFVRFWIVVWGVVFLCPLNFWCKRLFALSDTYFLVGVASALGVGTLGASTTPICLWLWYVTEYVYAPAIYVMIIMGCVWYAVYTSNQ